MSMNGAIIEKLNQLTQTRAQRANLAAEKQAAIDRIVTPEIKAQLDALEREFTETEKDLDFTIGVLEAEIKAAVLAQGASATGTHLQATWNKGRVTWDTRALDKYSALHPEIRTYRKEGEPFVVIRTSTARE
jgi:adenylate kinase family enzyme